MINMKSRNILVGLLACAALCACTDNDIINSSGTNGSQVFDGDKLYMIVNISEVGSAATKATSSGFSTGSENDVNDIWFYFYAQDGTYETYTDATTTWKNGTKGDNVELSGNKVVVLSGLANKEFPAYVVTVINKPDGFNPPATLDELIGNIYASASGTGIIKTIDVDGTDTDYFTMTTSSYFDDAADTEHDNDYYYATHVSADNFTTEPIEYDDADEETPVIPSTLSPVEIPVERLAVKVYTHTSITESYNYQIDGGKLAHREMGKNSVAESTKEYTIMKKSGNGTSIEESKTEIDYLFMGWALSGTERQSYMMKHLESSWMQSTPWTAFDGSWNEATNCRSYWGKSVHYGVGAYPDNYPTTSSEVNPSTDYLDYVCADDIQPVEGTTDYELSNAGYMYCAENTNTAGTGKVITSKYSSAITNVIVKAQLYTPIKSSYGNGSFVITELVKCNDVLYYTDAFLCYALSWIPSIYVLSSDGTTYTEIDDSYVELAEAGDDGLAKVVIKSADDDGNEITYYSDENGTTISAEDVQEMLDTDFNKIWGADANWYKNGYMYYYIPIQHLNNPTGDDIEEAQYGVVRNHYYDIKITGIDMVGRGIINPEEPIIPTEEPTKYYVGAEVQILSWKEVDQSVSFQ